jgi:uncharacterized RDD family membrane protein YckC
MTNPYAPPQAIVQDIADPTAGTVLAERGTRFGAALLDGLIFGVMVYLPMVMAFMFTGMKANVSGSEPQLPDLKMGLILAAVGFVAFAALNIKFMRANGQSVGKKACGIKVVRSDGSAASLSRLIWLRNVLNGLIGLIPMYGIIEVLFIFGEARRCLHDHIADTIVIKA